MNARPDAISFALFRTRFDEPALTAIRAAVNRGQPVVGDHFKEQVAVALGRRALARKRERQRQREVMAAQVLGQMGLNLLGERMRRKEIDLTVFFCARLNVVFSTWMKESIDGEQAV